MTEFTYHLPGDVPSDPVEHRATSYGPGRFYIRMGFAGFNSRANNTWGYASRAKALAAIRHYEAAGRKARGEL